MSYASFLDITGRYQVYFYPYTGDTGIVGTVVSVIQGLTGCGMIHADADQSVTDSSWAGAPVDGYGDPLYLGYEGQGTFVPGQRVSFDVIAAGSGVSATNLQSL
jgi:hypothetical protein